MGFAAILVFCLFSSRRLLAALASIAIVAAAVLSLATAVGNLASYYPKMTSNRATLRPRREQALMALVLLLAVGAFFLHPGIIGYILGAIAIVPASLFLLGTFTSGLPHQQPAVAVDALAPDFLGWTPMARNSGFRISEGRPFC